MDSAKLKDYILSEELNLKKKTAPNADKSPYFWCLNLIRQLDVFYFAAYNTQTFTAEDKARFEQYYQYGWYNVFNIFSSRLKPSLYNYLLFASDLRDQYWMDSLIQHSGKLELCKRYLELEKAGLVSISVRGEKNFFLKFTHELSDKEYFDRESFNFIRGNYSAMLEKKRKKHERKFPLIRQQMMNTVRNPEGTFIAYSDMPETCSYFIRLGYFHLMALQTYDDFSEDDTFGGIRYKHFLDFVQSLCGVALKHLEYCLILQEKNPKVDFYNILTYTWHEDKIVSDFAELLEIPVSSVKTIVSCLTLSNDNIDHFANDIGFIPPPYIKLGENQLTRSLHGALYGPLFFLRKELKRRFESDYFLAVNKRERRFKTELYNFLKSHRHICVEKEINITSSKGSTDIDAIVFDKKTKTLGLFQLKWQDIFAHNLKERRSRISNLDEKSIEWIDKVEAWLKESSQEEIIKKLTIGNNKPDLNEIKNIHLFVIARNHIHFTGQNLDERAAWGSWYQILHMDKTRKVITDNDITKLYVNLKTGTPEERMRQHGRPDHAEIDIRFAEFSLKEERR